MKPYDHMAVGPIDEHGNGPVVHQPKRATKKRGERPREHAPDAEEIAHEKGGK